MERQRYFTREVSSTHSVVSCERRWYEASVPALAYKKEEDLFGTLPHETAGSIVKRLNMLAGDYHFRVM